MKKVVFIIAGIFVAIAALYFILLTQTDLFVPQYQASDYQQTDYQNLAQQCKNGIGLECCLASVEVMKASNYQLTSAGKCPDGYKTNIMRCQESYQWCQPESE